MDNPRVVIIGASVTAHETARELRGRDKNAAITLITEEPYPLYDRRLLGEFIAGRVREKDLFPLPGDWYDGQGITLATGRKVSHINGGRRVVYFKERGTIGYDLLVVASGMKYELPDIPGIRKPGVFTLQTLEEAKAFMNTVVSDPVCVAGGAAEAWAVARLAAEKFSSGVKFIGKGYDDGSFGERIETLDTGIIEVIGDGRVQAVKTREGKVFAVSALIWRGAARANADFLAGTSIAFIDGFIGVDESLRTAQPRVFAAGAAARVKDGAVGEKGWDTCAREGGRLADIIAQEMESLCQTH